MIRKKIKGFAEYVCEYNGFSDEKKEEVVYTILLLYYEIIKILTLGIILAICGLGIEGGLVILVMITTKPFIGGYHEETHLRCFIFSFFQVFLILGLSNFIEIDNYGIILFAIILLLIVYKRAPIISEKMPITNKKLILKNKIKAIVIFVVWTIVALIINNNAQVGEMVLLTLIIQVLLMFNSFERR